MRSVMASLAVLAMLMSASPADATRNPWLLGVATVAHKFGYESTTVGGLSGIDHDPCTGEYVLISDDRSYQEPARFYTASIEVSDDGIGPVTFTGTHPFRQPTGETYPPPTLNDGKAVDPEELRVDPWTCGYWWAQEGNRPKSTDPVIQPSIQKADVLGAYQGKLRLPENYMITDDRGPRRNQAIEAITFDQSGAFLTSAIEGPLLEDGPVPTMDHGALIRVTTQTRFGVVLSQHAYRLEPIFAEPAPGSPWEPDTGVPAILADPSDPTRFLVLERTYVDGAGYKVRLFEATTVGATDVQYVGSLASTWVQPMRKRLMVDFHDLDLPTVYNVEGMTWGPPLSTGEHTLLLVTDDNFHPMEETQVIALVLP